jgi:hypothetical protein
MMEVIFDIVGANSDISLLEKLEPILWMAK